MKSDDLHATINEQMQWDSIENWQQFQDRVDNVDRDIIMNKVKALDKNERINWDHVEMRMDQAQERREQMNIKMQENKVKAQEKKERANAKIEENLNKVNENIDWETINNHVDRANAKINAIDWSFISNAVEKSADTIKNAKWDNVVRKEDKDLDWDLLSGNIDMVIEQINSSIDVIGEQFDNAHNTEPETEVVEVVQPLAQQLVEQAAIEFDTVPIIEVNQN